VEERGHAQCSVREQSCNLLFESSVNLGKKNTGSGVQQTEKRFAELNVKQNSLCDLEEKTGGHNFPRKEATGN